MDVYGPTFALVILFLLFIKHFIVDFPLQAFPYQYKNKGTYGHPGGLLHAGLHGLGTFIVIAGVFFYITDWTILLVWKDVFVVAAYLALIDMFLHYHIDWAKMNLNNKLGYGPTTHEQFWWLLGLDQYLHAVTYIMLVTIATF